MRTLKARWRSAQYLDAAFPEAAIPPSALLANIQKTFGLRWHLWLDARGRFLLTEHDQQHIVRALLYDYPTGSRPSMTVHFPRQTSEDEQRRIKDQLFQVLERRMTLLRRRVSQPRPPVKDEWVAPVMRRVSAEDQWENAILQPHDLDGFFAAHTPQFQVHVTDVGVFYIVRCGRVVAVFERYPLPASMWRIADRGPCRIKFLEARRTRRENKTVFLVDSALAILMNNRGYDPRTYRPYNSRPGTL